MAGPSGPKTNLPWLSKNTPEMEAVIVGLVQELFERKARAKVPDIDPKAKARLANDFKKAQQSRSPVSSFLFSLADFVKIDDPHNSVVIADMKAWEKAVNKLSDPNRNMNDLGRCRLLLDEVSQYRKLMAGLNRIKSDGSMPDVDCRSVKILKDTHDKLYTDYLQNPRKSGYAGSVNFDLEVDLGKGRKGKFEVQAMPKEYEEAYDHSHSIYDMITILHEIPENLRTRTQTTVLNTLVGANSALFIEQGERTGFSEVRENGHFVISPEGLKIANEILDRIRTEIEFKNGKKNVTKWQQEAMTGITYAKTSLMNIYLGQQKSEADPTPDYSHF